MTTNFHKRGAPHRKVLFILPVTIFSDIPFRDYDKIVLLEEPRYFTEYKFHRMKLLFHRMCLKNYVEYIKKKSPKTKVEYISFYDINDSFYRDYRNDDCYFYEPFDLPLEAKLKKLLPGVTMLPSMNFLMSRSELLAVKYKRQGAFYKKRRDETGLLMTAKGDPYGGKYSFDEENRKKLTDTRDLESEIEYFYEDIPASKYIMKYFPDNYGDCDVCYYPVTFTDAKKDLKDFIAKRLMKFTYQDAIVSKESSFPLVRLHHSCISAMLNVGLITDNDVLDALKPVFKKLKVYYHNGASPGTGSMATLLYSTEGFLRQVLGWRHYMLYIYLANPKITSSNFCKATKKLPFDRFWTGIGIEPIDMLIRKLTKYAYTHHIERLMVLGNYMFMMGYHPKDVYNIFMCWTIDSYDWVMASNIFTMSQFATGPAYTTKPYYASSNYILKMSDFKKGEWCEKFDKVYHDFKKRNPWVMKYNRF